jgi:hypothetical protein
MASSGASPALRQRADHVSAGVDTGRLEEAVRALEPGSRALLDLSLRRRVRDDDMASVLRVDPFHVAWLRARAIERVASELGLGDPVGIGAVRAALPRLPDSAWTSDGSVLISAAATRPIPPLSPTPMSRYYAPPRPPVADKLRSAAWAARSVARGAPQPPRPALRAALLTGAGAVLGFALSRRWR